MNPLDISDNLYLRFSSIREVKNYYGILAIYALTQTAEEEKTPIALARIRRILGRFPNQVEHPAYNFPSYRIGGIARAYALYRKILDDAGSEQLVKQYAEEMLWKAPKNPCGILIMPRSLQEKTWIDVVAAATPYMLFAGNYFKNNEYIKFAVRQCFSLYDDLLDRNGLLNQCRGFVAPGVKSKDHWSRGNGWGYFGLTELVLHLDRDNLQYGEAVRRFTDLSEALLPWQTEHGVWRQEIPEPMSYEESSGTGLILYGYGVGVRLGLLNERFLQAFKKGIRGIMQRFIRSDFSTKGSCPGCLCPGSGADKGEIRAYISENQPYQNEPHSFGPLMLALTEATRHGISDLKLSL